MGRIRSKTGMIVHGNWTHSDRYSASYGDHNKTAKDFKTLKEAKSYLRKHDIKEARYKASSGHMQDVKTTPTKRKPTQRKRSGGSMFGGSGMFDF